MTTEVRAGCGGLCMAPLDFLSLPLSSLSWLSLIFALCSLSRATGRRDEE